MNMQHLLQGK